KQKNGKEEAKTRRVLRDIGNLAIAPPPVDTKNNQIITRRVTRSFGAQILANAQAAAQKNHTKKPLLENAVVGKNASKKKTEENAAAKNDDSAAVVVISSDEEEGEEKVPKSDRKTTRKESKNKAEKSFTSILTARSKAACGMTKKPPAMSTEDIDAADRNNELAAVEYLDDMYAFYKEAEGENPIQNYIDAQPEINGKMRAILVDWLIEVHRKFELMPESLYLTVNILDRFLSVRTVSRRELQLVGISSMLIACKYEEIWAPEVNDFVAISDNAYIREQVLKMEKTILEKLDWYLTVPTCYVFLVRFAKASIPSDSEMENMTFFLAELGLSNYSTIIEYSPSKLSASAVYAARCTLNRFPKWTETLRHYTGYAEDQLTECAKSLIGLHAGEVDSKLRAVNRKYSDPSRGSVALFPPA
ncbi:hypothetical protein M569_12366, partial [Genlisea aurea]